MVSLWCLVFVVVSSASKVEPGSVVSRVSNVEHGSRARHLENFVPVAQTTKVEFVAPEVLSSEAHNNETMADVSADVSQEIPTETNNSEKNLCTWTYELSAYLYQKAMDYIYLFLQKYFPSIIEAWNTFVGDVKVTVAILSSIFSDITQIVYSVCKEVWEVSPTWKAMWSKLVEVDHMLMGYIIDGYEGAKELINDVWEAIRDDNGGILLAVSTRVSFALVFGTLSVYAAAISKSRHIQNIFCCCFSFVCASLVNEYALLVNSSILQDASVSIMRATGAVYVAQLASIFVNSNPKNPLAFYWLFSIHWVILAVETGSLLVLWKTGKKLDALPHTLAASALFVPLLVTICIQIFRLESVPKAVKLTIPRFVRHIYSYGACGVAILAYIVIKLFVGGDDSESEELWHDLRNQHEAFIPALIVICNLLIFWPLGDNDIFSTEKSLCTKGELPNPFEEAMFDIL